MAYESALQTLVGKVMSDQMFAHALARDPRKALWGIGVEPTPEMLDALEGVDPQSLQQLAAAFGDERAAAGS